MRNVAVTTCAVLFATAASVCHGSGPSIDLRTMRRPRQESSLIEAILPSGVAAAEAFDDTIPGGLWPVEEVIVSRAVEKRQREFETGRRCARRALSTLGVEAGPICSGEHGEPIWPEGVVGSITHCRGYRGAAVASANDLAALGIDAEPHEPLPDGLLADIAVGSEERRALSRLAVADASVHWDRVAFSAKEATYKAWFVLARRWLGFEGAALTLSPTRHTFSVRLLVPGPEVNGAELSEFRGRWQVSNGLILTYVAVRRSP